MSGAFLGPDYREDQIETFLKSENVNYLKYSDTELYDFITDKLIDEKIIGWFQGRMEFAHAPWETVQYLLMRAVKLCKKIKFKN